ncbi:PLDc N-terminal domain-containing protein [Tenacibaculum mesophilum]
MFYESRDRNLSFKLAWLIIILMISLIGYVFYFQLKNNITRTKI